MVDEVAHPGGKDAVEDAVAGNEAHGERGPAKLVEEEHF